MIYLIVAYINSHFWKKRGYYIIGSTDSKEKAGEMEDRYTKGSIDSVEDIFYIEVNEEDTHVLFIYDMRDYYTYIGLSSDHIPGWKKKDTSIDTGSSSQNKMITHYKPDTNLYGVLVDLHKRDSDLIDVFPLYELYPELTY